MSRPTAMPPLRVCHLGKYYPPAPGGIEAHVRTLALAQAALGAGVRAFCVNHRPGPTVEERDGDVAVTRFGRAASVPKLDICKGLARAIAAADVDVIHLHAPNPTMVLALLRARTSAAIVTTHHGDVVRQRLRWAVFQHVERSAYRRSAAVLTTSPTYPPGSRFLRPFADRLHVVPHGIDLQPYLGPTAEDRAEADRLRGRHAGPIWLGVGRLIYYKGFLNAVRALPRVPGTLLLVGDGPDRPALEAEAVRLGVRDRLAFAGVVPTTVPYYLAADAFWFPSNARSEAFGLVQVEAMASGCPVINAAIPHSGVAWVSPHEETGLTVPVDDPAALAAAALRLLGEPGLRDRLAAAGRERAAREFDHRVMAARSLDVYRDVLAASSSRPADRPALVPGR